VREAWHVIEPATPFVNGWHIDAICDHLEALARGEIRDLLVTMPPRHAKTSTIGVLYPAWRWLTRPGEKFLCASHALSLSTRDTLACRRLIESPWYQARWGDRVRVTSDQAAKMRFDLEGGGRRLATAVESSVIGEGGDCLIVDDPANVVDAVSSSAYRETARLWWTQAFSTRRNDPATSTRIMVMQRVHEDDLAAQVLSEGGWTHLNLPARYESSRRCSTSIGWTDPRTVEGEPLWPERYPDAELAKLERMLGSQGAAGQLQQRPAPAEGGVLKRAWWRRIQRASFPQDYDDLLTTWDLAFKGAAHNDPCAGFALGRKGADVYALGCTWGRLDFPAQLRAVLELAALHPGAVLVEDAANGAALIASLRPRIPGLIAIRADRSKEARVSTWAPWLEGGNLYLPEGEAWADDLEVVFERFAVVWPPDVADPR
jgi:phage terminase large subunit-like protein